MAVRARKIFDRRAISPLRMVWTAGSLIILILSIFSARLVAVQAAVSLQSFTATAYPERVLIEWTTATEYNNAGFYVQVSTSASGPFQNVSAFINALGDGPNGASYEFWHESVTSGQTYYYQLDMVATDNTSQYSNVISATPGGTTTPTSTATNTPTATATSGAYPGPQNTTSAPPTYNPYPGPQSTTTTRPQSTATRTPANQAGILQSTNPAGSLVSTPTQPSGTADPNLAIQNEVEPTFIPLPSITIQFPDTPTPGELSASKEAAGLQSADAQPGGRSSGRLLPLGVIVLIWILLGVWFYVSSRQLE